MNSVASPFPSLPNEPELLRYGPFELNRRSGELCRDGQVTRLQDQPCRVLELLILRTGDVVTRDELIAHVWPPGVVIDFDTGVNTAIRKLRAVLGDDAEHPRYIQTLPRRGYRLLPLPEAAPREAGATTTANQPRGAEPSALPDSGNGAAAAVPVSDPSAEAWPSAATGTRGRPVAVVAAIVVAVAVAVAVAAAVLVVPRLQDARVPDAGATAAGTAASGTAPVDTGIAALPRNTIAVLPFRNLGQSPREETMALGIAESLLHQLSLSPELTVIARGSSFSFRDAGADPVGIGRSLQARWLVDGALQSEGGQLRLTARLIDAASGRALWSLRFDRALADVIAVQDEIAAQVARVLQVGLAGRGPLPEDQGTSDVEAYLAYLQGRNLTSSRRVADLREAVAQLTDATRRDPRFAAAFAQLTRAHELLLTYDPPRGADDKKRRMAVAEAAARRALELAPSSAAAHVAVGAGQQDPAAAETYLRRAIALNPNYALAYTQLAELYVARSIPGPEAAEVLDKAVQLDPLEPRVHYLKALHEMYALGRPDAARAQLLRTLEVDPGYYAAYARLAQIELCCGSDRVEALRRAEQALALDPQAAWVRRLVTGLYLELGDRVAAEHVDAELPMPDTRFLLELHGPDTSRAVQRIRDPDQRDRLAHSEVGETFAARAVLIGPVDPLLVEQLRARAEESLAAHRADDRWASLDVTSLVDYAAALVASGDRAAAAPWLDKAFAEIERRIAKAPAQGLRELQAVALALAGRDDEAMRVLRDPTTPDPVFHWWYYARHEPAFRTLRARADFREWEAAYARRAAASRERMLALRRSGVLPDRGAKT
jgi:TolB-like protein/DNA-binding winged helix-turn-helix (wHTH) protein